VVKEEMKTVMNNNRMRFGNLLYHQIRGVALEMLTYTPEDEQIGH
jgi:hypothetical protein